MTEVYVRRCHKVMDGLFKKVAPMKCGLVELKKRDLLHQASKTNWNALKSSIVQTEEDLSGLFNDSNECRMLLSATPVPISGLDVLLTEFLMSTLCLRLVYN